MDYLFYNNDDVYYSIEDYNPNSPHKSNKGWPQQPLIERGTILYSKNWIFDDPFYKK